MENYLEADLQILTSPDIETGIVGAEFLKIFPVDGKESTSHCRTAYWVGFVLSPFGIPFWDDMPVELESPVEAADLTASIGVIFIRKCLVADNVNYWPDNVGFVPCDPVQQWL